MINSQTLLIRKLLACACILAAQRLLHIGSVIGIQKKKKLAN